MAEQIAAHGGGQKLNLEQGHAFISQEWGVWANYNWATTVFQLYVFILSYINKHKLGEQ